jgi:mono/diheme cytochrome c family protein
MIEKFLFVLALTVGFSGAASAEESAAQADKDAINIFNATCGWCHQGGGRVAGGIGPKLMNSTRDDEFILNRIKNGMEGKMPAFGGTFNDAQIHALLRYIRNLKPES